MGSYFVYLKYQGEKEQFPTVTCNFTPHFIFKQDQLSRVQFQYGR